MENKFVMMETGKIMTDATNIAKYKMGGTVSNKKIRDGNVNGKT